MNAILLVSSCPSAREVYTDLLRERGYHLTVCESAGQGLQAARRSLFDLAVVDLSLGGAGVDVCRQLKAAPLALPVVLLVGREGEPLIRSGLATGAAATVDKTSARTKLPATVRSLLNTASGPRTFAGYTLRRRLGAGGLGEVFAAESPEGRHVALKVLHAGVSQDTDHAARYQREVRLLRGLDLPHLARLIDAGTAQDRLYLVTEFVQGKSLHQILRGGARPSLKAALEVGRQTSRAIRCLADRGMVHRDIKPSNVMIDGRFQVTLVDYDLLLRQEEAPLTHHGVVVGTPNYLAPEVVVGDERGAPHSDLFSLGVTLYECLTRRRPYRGVPLFKLLDRIANRRDPYQIDELRPDLPAGLGLLIEHLTQPDPARRLCDPAEAEEAFLNLLEEHGEATRRTVLTPTG